VRENIRALDPEMGVFHITTLDQLVADSVAPRRFTTVLAAGFGALALLLAMTGIYGVVSHLVAERTREMGIRMALGAGRGNIFGLVVGHGMKLALAGLILGVSGALVVQRYLAAQLYEVSPADPLAWSGTGFLMAGVVFLACYVPARRATRVDPLTALRAE
jgi:putative ABC transport system permease protein